MVCVRSPKLKPGPITQIKRSICEDTLKRQVSLLPNANAFCVMGNLQAVPVRAARAGGSGGMGAPQQRRQRSVWKLPLQYLYNMRPVFVSRTFLQQYLYCSQKSLGRAGAASGTRLFPVRGCCTMANSITIDAVFQVSSSQGQWAAPCCTIPCCRTACSCC